MDRLGLPEPAAIAVLHGLVEEGYLAAASEPRMSGFELTVKGRALAQATAATPLHRSTVEKKLQELIERMIQVNASEEFLYGIEEAFIYGSYLTDTERLGDLDISVTLYRKDEDPDRHMEAVERCARESGRHFGNIIDRLFWPQKQVFLYLKQRSRVFSIHHDEPLLKHDPGIPRRAIFSQRRPVRDGESSRVSVQRKPRSRSSSRVAS